MLETTWTGGEEIIQLVRCAIIDHDQGTGTDRLLARRLLQMGQKGARSKAATGVCLLNLHPLEPP